MRVKSAEGAVDWLAHAPWLTHDGIKIDRSIGKIELRSSGLHEVCLVFFAESCSPVLQYRQVLISHIQYLMQQLSEPGKKKPKRMKKRSA